MRVRAIQETGCNRYATYSSAAIDFQAPPGLGFILNDEVKSRYPFIPGTGKFNGVPGDTWRMMSDQGRGHFSNFQILMNATHEYSRLCGKKN